MVPRITITLFPVLDVTHPFLSLKQTYSLIKIYLSKVLVRINENTFIGSTRMVYSHEDHGCNFSLITSSAATDNISVGSSENKIYF